MLLRLPEEPHALLLQPPHGGVAVVDVEALPRPLAGTLRGVRRGWGAPARRWGRARENGAVNDADPGRPARPHRQLTADGRRKREVLTYSRRGARLTDGQAEAWERRHHAWGVPDDAVDQPGFDLLDVFARPAPLLVEVGVGVGEATVAAATARPDWNVLAFEVWRPGVAQVMQRMERAGVDNVRVVSVDAVWALEHLLPPGSVDELWTFFPDPWPKTRHHKRRMVNPSLAAVVARRLRAGATWRLATDWAEYAERMREVLDAEPLLDGGAVPRYDGRPLTRFERKGLDAGRTITDLAYRRVADPR